MVKDIVVEDTLDLKTLKKLQDGHILMSLSSFNPDQRDILDISFQIIQELDNMGISKECKSKEYKLKEMKKNLQALQNLNEEERKELSEKSEKKIEEEQEKNKESLEEKQNKLIDYYFKLVTEQHERKIQLESLNDSRFHNDHHSIVFRIEYVFLIFINILFIFILSLSLYSKRKGKKILPVQKFNSILIL